MNPSPNQPSGKESTQMEYILVTDRVEGAFTIQMPKNWNNQAYLHLPNQLNRPIASSSSPNGKIAIYISDPQMPVFIEPAAMADVTHQMLVQYNPMYRVSPFVPAEHFFINYVQQKFGNLPGFGLISKGHNPAYHQWLVNSAGQKGANFYTSTISIRFSYLLNTQAVEVLITGSTVSAGTMWIADLYTVYATDHPELYSSIALHMLSSLKNTPQWLQGQRIAHQQQMAHMRMSEQNLRSSHQQIMATQRMQFENHQHHMKNRQDSFQASHQQWMDTHFRDNASYSHTTGDYNHEQFINAIREEHTVMDGKGNTYQVDNKHERYYINKLDGTYIGTDKTTELSDLARTNGIDVHHYEEVKIIR